LRKRRVTRSTAKFEAALRRAEPGQRYVLRLFVTGMTQRSTDAIRNIRAVCEEHLAERYDLEVVDLYRDPGRAREDQIVAAPTLVKKLPLPLRKLIGNLSETERVLVGLDLLPAS
jgi:circadian clock protein KaiB